MHFLASLWVKHQTRPLASDHNSHVCVPSSFLLWDLPEHDPDPGGPAELRCHGAGIAVSHCHGAYPYLQGLPGRGWPLNSAAGGWENECTPGKEVLLFHLVLQGDIFEKA